jgi:uncharacterized protein with FMN-binding domain
MIPLALAMSLALSCGGASKWKDGIYPGKADGAHGAVAVRVTVAKGRIARIEVLEQHEEPGVSDLAFKRIPEEMIRKQSLEVEAVTGASLSSKAIMAAAQDALRAAIKQ